MSCFTGCINTCKKCFNEQDEKKNEMTLQSDKRGENNNNNKGDNQSNKENNANNSKTSLFTFANNGIINKQSVEKINNIITTPPENNNSSTLVVKDNQISKTQNVINSSNSINENKIQNKQQDDTNEGKTEQKVEKEITFIKLFREKRKNEKANQEINGNKQNEIKLEQNNNININDGDDIVLKLINDLNKQEDEKDATNIKKAKKDLKLKSKNINKNKDTGNNNIKLQPSQKKYTGNKNILSQPLQTPEQIKKTDMHLHNFLTKIVIKICKLEESFCKNNNGNCSEFWKNLVGDNDKTLEKNDNLFTKVLNRNYNDYSIRENNQTLRLLGNDFKDITGNQKTSEIINQMVRQKSCKQLERLLRRSNADLQQLETNKNKHSLSLTGKVLTDPMLTTYQEGEAINKSTEIMLMLMNVQDMALEIYKNSNKQEKKHAKDILLFFRQVLTTLYQKKIISVLDKRPNLKQAKVPVNKEENRKYWKQLSSHKQIDINKENINFNLNKDTEEIEKIDLTKLFWQNGAQYEGLGFHHIQTEMEGYQQCIDEQPKFKLDNSIMLDEIKK